MFCNLQAQNWPKVLDVETGKVTIYQPQYDSLVGDNLYGMAAVSYARDGAKPVFGATWFISALSIDRSTRMASVQTVNVYEVRFPEDAGIKVNVDNATKTIMDALPEWRIEFSMEELVTSLEAQSKTVSQGFNDAPPEIIYRTEPTALIIIDGDPIWEKAGNSKVDRCLNSPSLMLRSQGKYYLMGNALWYESSTMTNWENISKPPKDVQKVYDEMVTDEAKAQLEESKPEHVPEIIVRTTPAELVQTTGEANLTPISGTNLLYVTNSESDILFDINKQQYYVLLSGRWFISSNLEGPWEFMPPSNLPADFAKIPEGNDKDGVLSNVPGTQANQEALMDAQVPQTASIERESATTDVQFDGKPEFESIENTSMKYAQNSDKQVLEDNGRYYCVDDGIWYEAESPDGPWFACTKRPPDVDNIPANHPAYNTRYVYIYDYTPTYVYCGYLPAYTGCYIYGGVPVYGTGWYYRPWYGRYYYPRPCTWGFNMSYNPWYGFSMGMNISCGGPYFNFNIHFGSSGYRGGYYGGYYGGWFGCGNYRPPYHPPYGGWYGGGRPSINIDNSTNININNNNVNNIVNNVNKTNNVGNLYKGDGWGGNDKLGNRGDRAATSGRPGVAQTGSRPTTRDVSNNAIASRPRPSVDRPTTGNSKLPNGGVAPNIDKSRLPENRPGSLPSTKPSTRPSTTPSTRPSTTPSTRPTPSVPDKSKDIYADPAGNVYQKSGNKYKQTKPSGSGWTKPQTRPSTGSTNGRNLNSDAASRQRAASRAQSYQSRPSSSRARSGGGARRR